MNPRTFVQGDMAHEPGLSYLVCVYNHSGCLTIATTFCGAIEPSFHTSKIFSNSEVTSLWTRIAVPQCKRARSKV